MPRAFFIGFVLVALISSIAAGSWRTKRAGVVADNEAAKARAAAHPPTPPASAAKVPAPAAPPPAKAAEPTRAAWFEAMMPEASEARRAKNPELQALYARKLRLELLLKNGAFLRSLHLSETERERLLSAWVERDLAMADMAALSREFGVRPFGPETESERVAIQRRMEEVESAVLGAEGRTTFEAYRRTEQVRNFVNTFVGEATLAGCALTADQADTVVAALVHSRKERPVNYVNQVDIATVESQLSPVLSPQQMELLLLPLRANAAAARLSQAVHAALAPSGSAP